MYIGTNVLMYERWLVLKVRYMAGRPATRPTQRFRHSIYSHCLYMWVNNNNKCNYDNDNEDIDNDDGDDDDDPDDDEDDDDGDSNDNIYKVPYIHIIATYICLPLKNLQFINTFIYIAVWPYSLVKTITIYTVLTQI